MRAYFEDLRREIAETTERGMSKVQDARLFGMILSSVERYVQDGV